MLADKKLNFSVDELNAADRQSVEAVEQFANKLFTAETVDCYLDEKSLGSSVKALYADVLLPFVEFLREQTVYAKEDMVLNYAENSKITT